jgi:hypothetical protein
MSNVRRHSKRAFEPFPVCANCSVIEGGCINHWEKPLKTATYIAMLALAGCANTGVVPMDKGTYLIAKKSPQVGFGPPIGIKGEAYSEANDFCAKEGKVVETLKLEQTNAGFAKSAAVSLEFRCVPK